MLSKVLTILFILLSDNAICFCQGVINNKQPYKVIDGTFYISRSDTLYSPDNFKLINYSDELPRGITDPDFVQHNIQHVVQTDDGYLWLSLEDYGLARYDGYHFRSFIPILGDSTSMPAQKIFHIVKSSKKGLWLVTEKGLVWFKVL
jgi:hypothetical protein